ncbi:hypothetical protein NUU61_004300 [Penicillium alfredii]|uniref:Uncharacterized protein n=1 Tax=Penicillium alfredii TaxID=1506179 RepID=A0A9W9FL04_9EURO|nr:uncharacterized protein NUU61_004300 [Penicillium alfredii]KAJ5102078.1 hypothetical protein NUU61_004300 [Penicillium alfredii]
MVALKKLFQTDKSASRPSSGLAIEVESTRTHLHAGLPSPGLPSPGVPSPGFNPSQSLDVAHHFEQIEKQFEDLHDRLEARPPSSQSQLPFVSNQFAPKPHNGRHIDLLDAFYSSDRYQSTSQDTMSPPVSPYNEDVAERNMTRFMRIQHRKGHKSSRILSALYQEDVADRNIAKYGGASRSWSRLSCRSSPAAPGMVRTFSPDGQRRERRKPSPGKSTWSSEEDLRKRSSSPDDASASSRSHSRNSRLRPQQSAPSLYAEEDSTPQEEAPSSPVQRLGVPPAHKQGDCWSNTPLPDSPTLPMPIGDSGGSAEGPTILRAPVTTARTSSLGPKSRSPPSSSGSGSKKNVRDLSINTQLAAQGRPKQKISHRAIQPPTPSNYEIKRTPSIAEVMHSPLPSGSASSSPRFKASEMMDLFNKAYRSTRAVSPHPTYETLQDAIVREINSHEAFRRVPVPDAGPPFTPSPNQVVFDNGPEPVNPELNRSASAKEKPPPRIISKGSFMKHKRNSESRRSISTSVPSKGYDRIFRRVSSTPARRRHTDAPPPSPGLLADIQQPQQEPVVPRAGTSQPLTYMDVLFRAGNDKSSTPSKTPLMSRKRGRSESAATISATAARATPDNLTSTPGAVYCLQAHSTPSKDGHSSVSVEDSDDDIIHLPSVGAPPPRVQIEGVDENNVRYVIDTTKTTDAHKLMGWSQRSRRSNSPQLSSASAAYQESLSPLSRARMQLRGSRSVETY